MDGSPHFFPDDLQPIFSLGQLAYQSHVLFIYQSCPGVVKKETTDVDAVYYPVIYVMHGEISRKLLLEPYREYTAAAGASSKSHCSSPSTRSRAQLPREIILGFTKAGRLQARPSGDLGFSLVGGSPAQETSSLLPFGGERQR
jgi:hypothetical protein